MHHTRHGNLGSSPDSFTTMRVALSLFFFFTDTATTEIYTLSLHDALPIFSVASVPRSGLRIDECSNLLLSRDHFRSTQIAHWNIPAALRWRHSLPSRGSRRRSPALDRKSTRLNSSHVSISYAVFCLKKKKK